MAKKTLKNGEKNVKNPTKNEQKFWNKIQTISNLKKII